MSGPGFLFAGGGTGGHIYPALAIAEKLLERAPSARIAFLCSTRPLDAEILKGERLGGQPARANPIPAQPFSARPRALYLFLTNWGAAVRASRSVIREFGAGGSVRVVAMGGFVAAPAAQAARVEHAPVALINLDAAPGRANRWIAGKADLVLTATPVDPAFGWEVIPPIVRKAALTPGDQAHCRRTLGLDPARPTLLVTGASQGARSINLGVLEYLCRHEKELAASGWQVVHQAGAADIEAVRSAYSALTIPARVEAFFREMGVAWGSADLAIARAGAGSVAEAWANRVPTIFLPYPFHKDEHQKLNARALVDAGGAVLLRDAVEPKANADVLEGVLPGLLASGGTRTLRAGLERLGPADGADRAARRLLS